MYEVSLPRCTPTGWSNFLVNIQFYNKNGAFYSNRSVLKSVVALLPEKKKKSMFDLLFRWCLAEVAMSPSHLPFKTHWLDGRQHLHLDFLNGHILCFPLEYPRMGRSWLLLVTRVNYVPFCTSLHSVTPMLVVWN